MSNLEPPAPPQAPAAAALPRPNLPPPPPPVPLVGAPVLYYAAQPVMAVPAAYPAAYPATYPAWPPGVAPASPWLRLGCFMLEGVLAFVTLGIGWLIWATLVVGRGQTPAKQLLRLRVINESTFRPAGFATMFFLRGIVARLIASILIPLTFGILLFMPFWSPRNQNLWDRLSNTLVVTDPHDAWRAR